MLKDIKYLFMRQLPTGEALDELAKELGVSQFGLERIIGASRRTDEAELQKRVMEAVKFRQQSMLWLIAVISATASVFSALAAWVAACQR